MRVALNHLQWLKDYWDGFSNQRDLYNYAGPYGMSLGLIGRFQITPECHWPGPGI
jgi:hypothetical protein